MTCEVCGRRAVVSEPWALCADHAMDAYREIVRLGSDPTWDRGSILHPWEAARATEGGGHAHRLMDRVA